MTNEDWDKIKPVFRRLHNEIKELWLEKQLLRNLIIDSQWMPENELDAGIEVAKKYPENIRESNQNWEQSDQTLAELGLDDWLAEFEKRYPHSG